MDDEVNLSQSDAWYRGQAKARWHDEGTIEIDENATVSKLPGNPERGAYVEAWVWVEDPPVDQIEDEASPDC